MGYGEAQYSADTVIEGVGRLFPNLSLSSRLMCRSSVPEDEGNLVTVSDGVNVWSKNINANLEAAFDIPGKARYTITVARGEVVEFTKKVDVGAGDYLDIEVGLDKKTWKGLKNILNAHLESTYCTVGDEIVETLGTGEKVTFRIAAINHDSAHQLIFESKHCLEAARPMNGSNTNAGGWNQTAMREWLNRSFYSYLSDELKAVISERIKKRSSGSQNTALLSAADRIWLPMEWEAFGTKTYAAETEYSQGGVAQFPIYATAANRIKTLGVNGAVTRWWLSSPHVGNSTDFCYVTTDGTPNGTNGAGSAYGVTPCFQIASP